MEKERYMREIEKSLLCTKDKKTEICRELRSDIEAAMESGEAWEAVEKRLGSPAELARELNENLAPKERQKAKRLSGKRIALIVAIVLACIIAAAAFFLSKLPRGAVFGNSGMFDEDTVKAHAATVIELASEEQWDELLDTCGAEIIQGEENKEVMISAKEMLGPLGAYQKVTSENLYELTISGETMAVIEVVALYEQRSVTYTLSFDKEMKLTGFYVK